LKNIGKPKGKQLAPQVSHEQHGVFQQRGTLHDSRRENINQLGFNLTHRRHPLRRNGNDTPNRRNPPPRGECTNNLVETVTE